jgi:hypothetical protein
MNHKMKKSEIRIRQLPTVKRVALLRIETGRTLQNHEVATINKLLRFGYDIFCQIEANLPYTKVADIVWRNEQWELKSIIGKSENTIADSLRKAKKQSGNVVMDISRSSISVERTIGKVKITLKRHKTIQKVLLIDKNRYCIIDRSAL